MKPKVYTVSDHDIQLGAVDSDALYVLNKLHEAGFTAYLVGGSVRDLLLKRTPKDFDISTSATPEEVKSVFQRQCLLIGKRFRLAHIRFGHKIIEVSTFRSGEQENDSLITRDNEWGTPEEDVLRRDFTINGLFYDPTTHEIIDFVGGWEDIHQNLLRTIGDPVLRFRQDPVRMIRLIKFRARFGFEIIPEARRALITCKQEIVKSSSARVLEEMLRMLESGASTSFIHLMQDSGLLILIYPVLSNFLKEPEGKRIFHFLSGADKINQSLGKKPLDRAILSSCLLFPMLEKEIKNQFLDKDLSPHMGDIIMASTAMIRHFEMGAFIKFPRRITAIMNSILSTQYRLTPLTGKKHQPKVFKYKDFSFALAFLKIRAIVDKDLIETYTHVKNLYRQHQHQSDRKGHHPHQSPQRIPIPRSKKEEQHA